MKKIIVHLLLLLIILFTISCKESSIKKQELEKKGIPKIDKITIDSNQILKIIELLKTDSLSIFKIKNKDSIIAFYTLRKGKAAWELMNNREILYNEIKKSKNHGLNPLDYNESVLKTNISFDSLTNKNNALTDIIFTDSYLSYVHHLANGKINPLVIYDDWKLDLNSFKFNSILNTSLENNSLVKSFDVFKPQSLIYKNLTKQLLILRVLIKKDSSRTVLNYGTKIKPLNSNKRIINIRKRLYEIGFLKDTLFINSEILDSILQKNIREFQSSKKLKTDAIIGDETIRALNETYQDKYNSILANLERFRWFPRKLGNEYIFVNIADYNLQHITKKDTTSYNVIVGKSSRKTPIFSSQVKYFEFNPKWYIPPTIKKEDVIPAAKKNIDYLRDKNISVFYKGKKLILDSINWSSNDPIKYNYVQSAGNSNALGRVKIIFPNEFSVYLHDTSSKHLFNKIYKARSSGCIRVQNVLSLAGDLFILDY